MAVQDTPNGRSELKLEILKELLRATRSGKISWYEEKCPDDWYTTRIGGERVTFRLSWYEATNQAGADPRMFEFDMPRLNAIFAFGTEGADLLFEILGAAFPRWAGHNDPTAAYEWLTSNLTTEQ
jgi:hypothetical protein